MEIQRTIGRHEILVDTSEPCGIYFEQSVAATSETVTDLSLEKSEILGQLAAGDEYFPLSLHWELLDRCNFACPFCYIVGHSFKKIVRFSEIRNHLAELVEHGLLFCTLTGGEVTIHPDFKAIYSFLKDSGVIVEVFSNGFSISDELVELFREKPPIAVEISLYTLDNDKLRNVYGVKDHLGATKVLENVLKLKRAGVSVLCKTFLNTVTRDDLAGILYWCQSQGIEHYSSAEITQAYDGVDLRPYQVVDQARAPSQNLHKKSICLPCKTKNYGSALNASFSIFPCPAIKLPDCTFDLREKGVKESMILMKAFMRKFQDSEIQGTPCGPSGCATCMAFAKPVRNDAGEILHFAHP